MTTTKKTTAKRKTLREKTECGLILGFRIPFSRVQPENWDEDEDDVVKQEVLSDTIKELFKSETLAYIIPDNECGDDSEGLGGIAYLGIPLVEYQTHYSDAGSSSLPTEDQKDKLYDLRDRYELLKGIRVELHSYSTCD